MRRLLITGLLLAGVVSCFGGNDAFVVREAAVTIVKGRVRLRIRLAKPSSLMIHYDTQRPAKPNDVGSYWYSHYVGGEVSVHNFELPELAHPARLFFGWSARPGKASFRRCISGTGNKPLR
jgi:hypothetical protein